MSKGICFAKALICSTLIAYGLCLIHNETAVLTVQTNLTTIINNRPEILNYLWIADHADKIVKLAGLVNILSIAILFSTEVNNLILMNIASLFLSSWLVFNPIFMEDKNLKKENYQICLKNIALMGGLMLMKIQNNKYMK